MQDDDGAMQDDDGATLGVGFAIDFHNSFGELKTLDDLIGTTQANAVREFQRMEAAAKGLNLGGATASVQTFGNEATRELANVRRETTRAEKAAEDMVRQLERSADTFGKSASEIRRMRAEVRALAAEDRGLTEVAGRLRAAAAEMDRLEAAGAGVGKRSRGSMTQLSFQLNDVTTMAMSGSGAMQIFGTQAGQIFQVAQQAEGGVKGFAAELGGVALKFAPIALAAAAGAAAIGIMSSEINENGKVHVSWMDTLLGSYDAVKAYLTGQLTSAFTSFGVSTGDVWGTVVDWTKWAINRVIGITSLLPRMLLDNWKLIPAGVADIFYSSVNTAIDAINSLISKSVSGVNGFIATANSILSKADMALPTLSAPQIGRVTNSYAGAGVKAGRAMAKSIGDTMTRDFIGDMASAISPFAQKRAVERAKEDAKKAGKAAGSHLGKAMGNKAVEDLLDTLKKAQLLEFYQGFLSDQERQWKEFNERVGNTVNDQVQQRLDDDAAAAAALNQQLERTLGLLGGMGKVGGALGGALGILTGNTAAVGGAVGAFLNMDLTGTDKDGKQIASTIGEQVRRVFDTTGPFAQTLRSVLMGAGTGMLAGNVLFGNQSGTEKLGSAIGGALGGKVGEKFLKGGMERLAKGLGDFAGPIGSIAGGIAGNLLGSLFTKVKWGAATLSASGVSGGTGNSDAATKAALAAGNSIFGSLESIASQLNGRVADFGNFTIGVRHGDYRVNTDGTSLKKKKGAVDFDDDAEAAALYAMQQAINRGAIAGIRASTGNLLKLGDDLQGNLDKALRFEGVFSDLKARLDPVGSELDSLTKQFDQLRDVFKQAGASAEEYAQLEQLLALKRDEVMQKERDALSDVQVRILRAQGNDAAAIAIERQQELASAMTDAVRVELQRLYAIEDSVAAQQKLTDELAKQSAAAQELRDAWSSVGDDIMDEVRRIRGITDGTASGSFAMLMGQFNAATSAARGGDKDAAERLVDLSQSLLAVAGNTATSRQELERVKAQTAASLEATHGLIGAITGARSTSSTAGILAAAATSSQAAPPPAAQNDAIADELRALREEVSQLRQEQRSGLAAVAVPANRTVRILEGVTEDSGGRAISVGAGR